MIGNDDGHPRPALRRALAAALATILAASAIPFGYTIATWSSGALLITSHGEAFP